MPYATATRFCAAIGYDDARTYLIDEGAVLTADLVRQAVAVSAGTGDWAPETTAPEKVVAMAALDMIDRQLVNTSNFIDGYLRTGGVTLPLPEGDANAGSLEDCCVAIARDELASDADKSTDQVKARADRWRQWLRDVARKVTSLVAFDGQPAPTTGSVRTGQPRSGWDWATHSQGQGGFLP